ncbi:ABC transporter ATP-binding protein [Frankia canadensis]|nr:ABC transporter ATP-binding protein [Frankia canadensis]
MPERGLADLDRTSPRELLRLVRTTTPTLARALIRGLPLTLLLALAAGAGRIVTPLTVQYALDHGLSRPGSDLGGVVGRAVAVGAAATVGALLASWWLNLRVYRGVEAALAEMRAAGIAHLHALAPGTSAAVRPADLTSRLTADLDAVTTFVQNGGVMLLVSTVQMVLAAGLIAAASWQLALPVLGLAGLLFLGMRRLQAVVGRRFTAARRAMADLASAVGEAVAGITVIRATATEARTRAAVDAAVEDAAAAQRRVLLPLSTSISVGELAISTMTAFVVVAGVRWSGAHTRWEPALHLSAGQLVAILLLVTFFVRPLQTLVQMLGEAQNAVAGGRRALELLVTPTGAVGAGAVEGAGALPLPAGPIDVELRAVSAAYGEDGPPVLRGLNVVIAPGEHIAVVGETGSGKTTFARLLTRELAPRDGEVLLCGVPAGRIADRSFARRVTIVPQDPFLFDVTIAENILLAHRNDGDGGGMAALAAIVAALGLRPWLDSLPDGPDTRVGVRGERLSAGERQLVALARTALVNPDLLVLDEATSGVDPATDVRVQRALAALTAGRTTVSIAHRMVTAERADRILVFDDGRLVQDGHHDELVRVPGRYADLHAAWREHTATRVPHQTSRSVP